jgi:hypothetical protein
MNFSQLNIQYLIIGIIITYIPFHLFEESLGNFPAWMYEHKWMPEKITYGHWMANNIFFYYTLILAGFIGYYFGGDNLLFLGGGILVWGLINCLDHLVYTIIDRRVSPGLLTGFIFATFSISGLYKLYLSNMITLTLVIFSVLIGLIYAFLPIVLSIKFNKVFRKIYI